MMMFVIFLDSDAPEMKMTDSLCLLIPFLVVFLFLILLSIDILGTLGSLHLSQYTKLWFCSSTVEVVARSLRLPLF